MLYVDASDESMKKRLLHRGQSSGRVDDNEETIKNRLKTFHDVTEPVIDHYNKQNKLKKVDAERTPDVIFKDIAKILDGVEEGNWNFFCINYLNGLSKINIIIEDERKLREAKVIFVVGGPGSGKVNPNNYS